MFFSSFTSHFAANQTKAPRSVMLQIRREAIARVTERMQAGRADCALDFSDLINRIEDAVRGK